MQNQYNFVPDQYPQRYDTQAQNYASSSQQQQPGPAFPAYTRQERQQPMNTDLFFYPPSERR